MGIFVKLTDVSGKTIFVNVAKIRYVGDGYVDSRHTACLHMEQYNLDVLERPEEVVELANCAVYNMFKQINKE